MSLKIELEDISLFGMFILYLSTIMVNSLEREGEGNPDLTPERRRLVKALCDQFLRNPNKNISLPQSITEDQGRELAAHVEDALWAADPDCWERVVFESFALRLDSPLSSTKLNDDRELAWARGFIALKTAIALIRIQGADKGVWKFEVGAEDHAARVHNTLLHLRRAAGLKLLDLRLDGIQRKLYFRHEGFESEQPESSANCSNV